MVVVFSLVRRLLIALALCSAAVAAFSSSASARSYRHSARHTAHVRHVAHYGRHYVHRQYVEETESRPGWDVAGASNWNRAVSTLRQKRFAHVQASAMADTSQGANTMTTSGGFGGGSELVSEARRYLGGNPTSRRSLWCARFMNMVLERTGHHGTGSDMASSFAGYGHRISGPQVGAIAVMGHHVGIITGVDASGNPIMISGNNGNRVREAPISRGRIYAYVMPN
jgi:uncharacterized protein (TIGR02594 family)